MNSSSVSKKVLRTFLVLENVELMSYLEFMIRLRNCFHTAKKGEGGGSPGAFQDLG